MQSVELIKKLREETGAGVLEVKTALEENDNSYEKAREILMEKAQARAAKKADRTTKDGLVDSYIHLGGRAGSLVLLACETDFVAKTDDFKKLAHEIAMQVCTQQYKDVEDLLNSEYIRDPSKKISDLVTEVTAKVGEKIEIRSFVRLDAREV